MSRLHAQSDEIERGLGLLLLLLPLAFFPGLIRLYGLPKETLLAFLTAVLCCVSFVTFYQRNERPVFPLLLPVLIYLALTGFSLFKALNLHSGIVRYFQLIVGIGLFWVIINHVSEKGVEKLLRWVVWAGLIASVIGIAQQWGMEFPTLIQVSRPSSTFGNKNMAAQFILFVLPAAFYLLMVSSRQLQEWFYAAAASLTTTYFIYTGTRASWAGAIAAGFILWFCLRLRGFTPGQILSWDRRKSKFLAGVLLFVMTMNVFPPYLVPGWRIAGSPSAGARLLTMADPEQQSSFQNRIWMWANTVEIFKDYPLLGVGIGNFEFMYPLYNRAAIEDKYFGVQTKPAESHNDYLQFLAETGLLGTAAFLLILFLLACRFWHSLNPSPPPATRHLPPACIPIAFALIGILAVALLDFPFYLPVSFSFFWIYAGFLWKISADSDSQGIQLSRKPALAVLGAVALAVTASASIQVMHLRGEFYFGRAMQGAYGTDSVDERLVWTGNDLDKAIEAYPFDHRYHHWKGILKLRQGKKEEALQATVRVLSMHPYNINALNNLGVIYATLGDSENAIRSFETVLKIWPDYVDVHNRLGVLYAAGGENVRAVEHFRAALRLDPSNEIAKKKLNELLAAPSLL
ncbi:MAG: O-antigen ligase family protein [Acidobacteriota bacterium]